jgi:hypothetical protein
MNTDKHPQLVSSIKFTYHSNLLPTLYNSGLVLISTNFQSDMFKLRYSIPAIPSSTGHRVNFPNEVKLRFM